MAGTLRTAAAGRVGWGIASIRTALGPAGLLALLAAALIALPADAEARRYPTTTSFGFYANPDAFLGQVASSKAKCRAGRLVKVFRKRRGGDRLIGRDRANRTGQWAIEREVPRARYYALVPRKRFGPRGRHVCRAYRSSVLTFG